MFNFFVESEALYNNTFSIMGNDYNHIKNVLRMQAGDTFLVSCDGKSHLCSLSGFTDDTVLAEIVERGNLVVICFFYKNFSSKFIQI